MGKLKSAKKKPEMFSNGELLALVLFLSETLDEAIDAVYLAAVDDSFPTCGQMTEMRRTQETICVIAEAAANALFGSETI